MSIHHLKIPLPHQIFSLTPDPEVAIECAEDHGSEKVWGQAQTLASSPPDPAGNDVGKDQPKAKDEAMLKCRENYGNEKAWDQVAAPDTDPDAVGMVQDKAVDEVKAAGNANRAPRWTMTFVLAQDSDVTRKCREGIGGKA